MNTDSKPEVWKDSGLASIYLNGVRGAIPLAQEQLETIHRIAASFVHAALNILDLGCGDGILGFSLLDKFPKAECTFIDFSPEMISAAKKRAGILSERSYFIECDYGIKNWTKTLGKTYDIVVSGFSIHHQTNQRKKEIYAEIYEILNHGGIFLNLEHVKSRTPKLQSIFDEVFIDSLYSHHSATGNIKTREEIVLEFYARPDKASNILEDVWIQCDWLREAGFKNIDCFMKYFELALFGGSK